MNEELIAQILTEDIKGVSAWPIDAAIEIDTLIIKSLGGTHGLYSETGKTDKDIGSLFYIEQNKEKTYVIYLGRFPLKNEVTTCDIYKQIDFGGEFNI